MCAKGLPTRSLARLDSRKNHENANSRPTLFVSLI
jgi:hypothetical protein